MKLSGLLSGFHALLRQRRVESELEEELATHLELQSRKYVAAGMNAGDAMRRARLDFGARESVREECREARSTNWLSKVAQDLRYAIRMFRRAPAFSGFVIVILALGMGANLSTFSVIDAIMLRLLPVKDPGSLFRTVRAAGDAYGDGSGTSYPLFVKMQERARAFADLMAYQTAEPVEISLHESEPQRLMQQTISGNYFDVLGVQPAFGRMISPEDDRRSGRHAVAVISYRLWKNKLDGSSGAMGSKLLFDDHVFEIIGVAPPQFFGVEVGRMVDVWTPISMAPAATLTNDHDFWLRTVGRVKPDISIAQAAAPLQAVMNEFMLEDVRLHAPPGTPKTVIDQFLAGMRIKGIPAGGGISYLRRQYEQPLRIMMFVVGLVMLIACSNVANLLIARGSARGQEVAIRLSLGAGRFRVLQQLLTESLLLAVLSAGAGLLVAHWATPVLIRLLTPSSEPANLATHIDLRLLTFTFLLVLVTVMVCGLLPAIRLAGTDVQASLKNGQRLTAGGSGRARRILVTAQVALSLILIVGAGLFTFTLKNLLSSNLGFNPRDVLIARMTLKNSDAEKSPAPAWDELFRRVTALPGVEHAALSSAALFTGDPPLMGIRTNAGKALPPDPLAGVSFVSNGVFSTLEMELVRGRDFDRRDQLPANPAFVIVNQAFAHKFFGDENPLGRKLTKMANSPDWTEIIGLVKDVKVNSLRDDAPPMVYVPYGRMADWITAQRHSGMSLFLLVQGHQSESSLAAILRQEAGSQFTVGEISRQQQLIDDTLVRERLLAQVGSIFGGLALVLAGLGLYGIVSYTVAQRRQELGLRMALGAGPRAILGLMLRDSAMVVGLGTIVGLAGAGIGSHWTRTLLYGLAPNDAKTFIAASLLLLAVSLIAAFIPAYRAAETDPMTALRHD